eukprot:Em0011g70a
MVKVGFIHPDLGIGGAERLIVDAALALKSRGHEVELFTAHHDPGHCFAETKNGTFEVTCVGDWLPRHVFHKGYALCAYIRMIYVAIYVVYFSGRQFDVIVCDQISACIPVLTRGGAKIIFYCHFPDQLLTERKSRLKRAYRWPLDKLEEKTTGMADAILVNSKFTEQVFYATFKSLTAANTTVLYPSLNCSFFDQPAPELDGLLPDNAKFIFLSINRFERKKNLPLAIRALAALLEKLSPEKGANVHLVVAGGYDERVVENKEHYLELNVLVDDLKVSDHITFLRSFSDQQKVGLLSACSALLYTPSGEHFGICPLEAMYMGKPVVAVNSGGPLETVINNKTGYLCDPVPPAFAECMGHLVNNPHLVAKMGAAGRSHVQQNFSFKAFTRKLDNVVMTLTRS